MKKILSLAGAALLLWSCAGEETAPAANQLPSEPENKVLLLKVDFNTNAFEGGKELSFDQPTETFTVGIDYQEPGDFGWVKMSYAELQQPLFEGEIHWNGEGQLLFPQDWQPASAFDHVLTDDFRTPAGGFDFIFDPMQFGWGCSNAWASVQGLVKVRAYLDANPDADVKVFLYTPGVGIGDPEKWKWIFILKN